MKIGAARLTLNTRFRSPVIFSNSASSGNDQIRTQFVDTAMFSPHPSYWRTLEAWAMNEALEKLYGPEVEQAKEEGRKKGGGDRRSEKSKAKPDRSAATYGKAKKYERSKSAKKARATGMSPKQWEKLEGDLRRS